MLWENLREEEFENAIKVSNKVCVVPIGCLEKHGQHLPVGTDTQTASYIARKAAEIEPVVVFPGIYFGDLLGLYMWKGTIAFSSELLQQMLTELCAEIARNGFKKILLLNGHGGNGGLLANFLRSTAHEKKDYVVMKRNEFQYTHKDILADLDAGDQIDRFPVQKHGTGTALEPPLIGFGHGKHRMQHGGNAASGKRLFDGCRKHLHKNSITDPARLFNVGGGGAYVSDGLCARAKARAACGRAVQ